MNHLSSRRRAQVEALLRIGNGQREIARRTGVDRGTIRRIAATLGSFDDQRPHRPEEANRAKGRARTILIPLSLGADGSYEIPRISLLGAHDWDSPVIRNLFRALARTALAQRAAALAQQEKENLPDDESEP